MSAVDGRKAIHRAFMEVALAEARRASLMDEVPVGAVITRGGDIIAKAHNERETAGDPTAHAEILAIRQAARELKTWRLDGTTLYVTKEPCPMCAGAIVQSRIKRVVFGAADEKAGFAGTLYNVLQNQRLNHQVEVVGGVCDAESQELLQKFFQELR